MRNIRELLRLKFALQLSDRRIAASIGVSRSTVQQCLQRAAAAGIGWPLLEALDDATFEARLYVQACWFPPKIDHSFPLKIDQVEIPARGRAGCA